MRLQKERTGSYCTLATGTGKTFIAFQIAFGNYFKRDGTFNTMAREGQEYYFLPTGISWPTRLIMHFLHLPKMPLVRISPKEIRKKGSVPTNGSIFFTIFQTFMSGKDKEGKSVPYFGEYPADYFDFIVIDECHHGGAN